MEVADRFSALACLDLPFVAFAWEFCGIDANTALDDATLNSLFWIGANYHRPVDLPDTPGLSWREGILRCLESVQPRSRSSPPSSPSPVPHSSPLPFAAKASSPDVPVASPPASPLSSPPAPAPELLDSALPPEFSAPILTPVPAPPGPVPQVPAPPERPPDFDFPNNFFFFFGGGGGGGGVYSDGQSPLTHHGRRRPLILHGRLSPLTRHGSPGLPDLPWRLSSVSPSCTSLQGAHPPSPEVREGGNLSHVCSCFSLFGLFLVPIS